MFRRDSSSAFDKTYASGSTHAASTLTNGERKDLKRKAASLDPDQDHVRTKLPDSPQKPDATHQDAVSTEYYSTLRLKNRLVSSAQLKEHTQGRKFVKLCQISSQIDKTQQDIEGNWITIGAIGEKSQPKIASNGKKFCILKLTDFAFVGGKLNLITVFLFEKAFERHWKEATGCVIALLNPKLVPPNDNNQAYALSIDNPDKIMKIGTSADFAVCRVENCRGVINKSLGGKCEFHNMRAYKKHKLHRSEFAAATNIFTIGDPQENAKQKKQQQTETSYMVQDTAIYVGESVHGDRDKKTSGVGQFRASHPQSAPISKEKLDWLMSQPTAGARHLRLARNAKAPTPAQVRKKVFNAEQLSKMGYLSPAAPITERKSSLNQVTVENQPDEKKKPEFIELTDEEDDEF
ncbi:hypothetical protein SeMB42_g05480 [Synchytrium endobioticum]|uniref:MCM10 OB-fold domain-containing protein n=1 Tax=Synchytrium endobioticum TaxID=286115 RepID=A0A507DEP0_9FUNG|nr:hypothetical protein SeMB42_g05480 [Synchytrium endobioticum]TPX49320.1 hypothetical protein SeLEV6574_g01546 [Synchytrium endobioticum]